LLSSNVIVSDAVFDGMYAGLRAFADVLADFGTVTVIFTASLCGVVLPPPPPLPVPPLPVPEPEPEPPGEMADGEVPDPPPPHAATATVNTATAIVHCSFTRGCLLEPQACEKGAFGL
jgi:hypothetical protein